MMKQDVKNELLQLTQQKDSVGIKALLESLDNRSKGSVFEWYLAELYKGNGWLVKVQGGRGDLGADILLYHPKEPSKVSLIIQAKNHANSLTFDQTKIELIKFEQQASYKYNCQQFNLVAVNGFVEEAQKLSQFNMLLSCWNYVANLIKHFDPVNITEPEIELYAHNKDAYEKARELWQRSNCVAVVQATGTGKSLLIAKVLADFLGENNLVMAPSNYILDQQKLKVPWATQSTTFMTYAKGVNLIHDEIKKLDVKLIVLDEFHRCGAEVWGTGIQRLLDANPEAYVFGTTATPIRYLDSSRDMSDELFGGVVAVDLSLAEAIIRKILPTPDYVAALYTLDEEIEGLMETLESTDKSNNEKKDISAEINRVKLDWEQTSGIPEILKKHLKPHVNKFIVFCKDQEHVDKMEIEVQKWFQKAGMHRWRKVYRVISADPESNQNLEAFKKTQSPNTAHLLFAIDMLNEGLHISDVGAVILLRPTESPIIFYQQIGRCIQINVEHTPIIFDFVNNFQNIRANDFFESLKEARELELEHRASFGLEEYAPAITVTDETKRIRDLLESISERLQPWEVIFQQLVDFKNTYKHCNVPNRWQENPKLGNWVEKQRIKYRKGILPNKQIKLLESIGFVWDPLTEFWEENFIALVMYKRAHGNCNVPNKWQENTQLSKWVSYQRQAYKKGLLDKKRADRLKEIGFDWDPLETAWEESFNALINYKKRYNNCNVPRGWIKNPSLSVWVGKQRQFYTKGQLSEKRIKRMEEIGFVWQDPREIKWEENFKKLVAYRNENGHCNIPDKWSKNPTLGRWVGTQRHTYKKGRLNKDKIRRLEKIDFIWDPIAAVWDENYNALVAYRKTYGHCNVPRGWEENHKLGKWVRTQRSTYKKGKLSKDKIRRLEKIGFTWDLDSDVWERGIAALRSYKEIFGDCNVPRGWSENPELSLWVNNQRQAYKKNRLSKNQINRLKEIGFVWNVRISTWEKNFSVLKDYRKLHGHCNVPRRWKENPELSLWVNNQRKAYKKNRISKNRIKKMEEIGFVWDPLNVLWEENFKALVTFKRVYRNCNVPNIWQENPKLSKWVSQQRQTYKKGLLDKKRADRLKEIGFDWDPLETIWEESFNALINYKQKYGNFNVPRGWIENPSLSVWVGKQRQFFAKGQLSEKRIRRMEEIGFVWDDPRVSKWEENFTKLAAYRKRNGHCNVPDKWSKNPTLGRWVGTQRRIYKKGRLSNDKIRRLENIGFIWDILETKWEEMFSVLVEFKEAYGHCNVPNSWRVNPKLRKWISHQRSYHKKGKLSEDRIRRLEKIGFQWQIKSK